MDGKSSDRSEWITHGIASGAKAVVIMYDPEDKEEYPVYVGVGEDLELRLKQLKLSVNLQKIVDVVEL